jgi:hypothetical protein
VGEATGIGGVEPGLETDSSLVDSDSGNEGDAESGDRDAIDAADGKLNGKFLGASIDGMLNEGKKGPGIPPSLMSEKNSVGGDWAPHGDQNRKQGEESDPRERAGAKLDNLQEKGKAEHEDNQDAERDEFREKAKNSGGVEPMFANESRGKTLGRDMDRERIQDRKRGQSAENLAKREAGSKWQEDDIGLQGKKGMSRKGGSAVSDASFLPKGDGNRLSDGKSTMGQFDRAVMGMNQLHIRAEVVSAWNEKAVREYKEGLLKDPGAAGDLARRQHRMEHPGAI